MIMFKAKAVEIIKCNHCGKDLSEGNCVDCNTWFEDDETIYCDEVNNCCHHCKKCGGPKYRKHISIYENTTLDDFS